MKSNILAVLCFGILVSHLTHAETVGELTIQAQVGVDRIPNIQGWNGDDDALGTDKVPQFGIALGPRWIMHRQHAFWFRAKVENPSIVHDNYGPKLGRLHVEANARTIINPDFLFGGYILGEGLFPYYDHDYKRIVEAFQDTEEYLGKVHIGFDFILPPFAVQITLGGHYTVYGNHDNLLSTDLIAYDIGGGNLKVAVDVSKKLKIAGIGYYRYHGDLVYGRSDIQNNIGGGLSIEPRFNKYLSAILQLAWDYHSGPHFKLVSQIDILGSQSPEDQSLQSYLKRDIPKHVAPITFLGDLNDPQEDDREVEKKTTRDQSREKSYSRSSSPESKALSDGSSTLEGSVTDDEDDKIDQQKDLKNEEKELNYLSKNLKDVFEADSIPLLKTSDMHQACPEMYIACWNAYQQLDSKSEYAEKLGRCLSLIESYAQKKDIKLDLVKISNSMDGHWKLRNSFRTPSPIAPEHEAAKLLELLTKYDGEKINLHFDENLEEILKQYAVIRSACLLRLEQSSEVYKDSKDLYLLRCLQESHSNNDREIIDYKIALEKYYSRQSISFSEIRGIYDDLLKQDESRKAGSKRSSSRHRQPNHTDRGRSHSRAPKESAEKPETRARTKSRARSKSGKELKTHKKHNRDTVPSKDKNDSDKETHKGRKRSRSRTALDKRRKIEQPENTVEQLGNISKAYANFYFDIGDPDKIAELLEEAERKLDGIIQSRLKIQPEKQREWEKLHNESKLTQAIQEKNAFNEEEEGFLKGILEILEAFKVVQSLKEPERLENIPADCYYLAPLELYKLVIEKATYSAERKLAAQKLLDYTLEDIFDKVTAELATDIQERIKSSWSSLETSKSKIKFLFEQATRQQLLKQLTEKEGKILQQIHNEIRSDGRSFGTTKLRSQEDRPRLPGSKHPSFAEEKDQEDVRGRAKGTSSSIKREPTPYHREPTSPEETASESEDPQSDQSADDADAEHPQLDSAFSTKDKEREIVKDQKVPENSQQTSLKMNDGPQSYEEQLQSKNSGKKRRRKGSEGSSRRKTRDPSEDTRQKSSAETRDTPSNVETKPLSKKEIEALPKVTEKPSIRWAHKKEGELCGKEIFEGLLKDANLKTHLESQGLSAKISDDVIKIIRANPKEWIAQEDIGFFSQAQQSYDLYRLKRALQPLHQEISDLFKEKFPKKPHDRSNKKHMVQELCEKMKEDKVSKKDWPEFLRRAKQIVDKMPNSDDDTISVATYRTYQSRHLQDPEKDTSSSKLSKFFGLKK